MGITRLLAIQLVLISAIWCPVQANVGQASSAPDSINVVIVAPAQTKFYIEQQDEFGNTSLLTRGTNRLPVKIMLRDAHWQSQTLYLIDGTNDLRFVQDETKKYWLLRSGDSQRDRELNFYVAYRKEIEPTKKSDDPQNEYLWTIENPVERERLFQNRLDKQLFFLKTYALKHKLSDDFVQTWQQILHYEMRMHSVRLNPQTASKSHTQTLTGFASEFTADSALFIPAYRHAATGYASLLATGKSGSKNPSMLQRYNVAATTFTGKTRDYVLTSVLLMAINKEIPTSSQTEFDTCLAQYFADCQTYSYEKYVRRATSLRTGDLEDGTLLSSTNQPILFGQATTQALATYVDFWASWCVPCREEMPNSKKLSADYGPKGVRFLYVSLDKNPAAWDRAMKIVGLNKADSYLLVNDYKSSVAKRFTITTIPRYLLIDKTGRVVSSNAPRPGTPEIRKLLEATLKK